MKTVKISEFKAHPGVLNARAERLMAQGILTPPRRPLGEERYWPEPVGDRLVSKEAMAAMWEEERADR
jgi:hypothetical protein